VIEMSPLRRLSELIKTELERPVPPQLSGWHLIGGLALALLLIEIVSGVLLMVYYRPSAEAAYESVQFLMSHAQLGWLVRGIHKWAADLFILVILLHLLRVYFHGAYREREVNWAVGVLLLLFLGAFAFTGIPLVWNQQAFWGTEAVRKVIERVPLLGPAVLGLLWGGRELTGEALLRFYVFHVGILPWLMIAFVAGHLYLISRQGLFGAQTHNNSYSRRYSDVILDGMLVTLLVFGALLTLAVLFAPALGDRADPLQPEAAKTAWYFLPAYGLLKAIPIGWGLLIIAVMVLFVLFIPLLDRRLTIVKRRWIAQLAGAIAIAGIILLGMLGYLRGGL